VWARVVVFQAVGVVTGDHPIGRVHSLASLLSHKTKSRGRPSHRVRKANKTVALAMVLQEGCPRIGGPAV